METILKKQEDTPKMPENVLSTFPDQQLVAAAKLKKA